MAGQKSLEQRIMNLEKSVNNNNNTNNTNIDPEYIKVINILIIIVCIKRKLMQTYILIN